MATSLRLASALSHHDTHPMRTSQKIPAHLNHQIRISQLYFLRDLFISPLLVNPLFFLLSIAFIIALTCDIISSIGSSFKTHGYRLQQRLAQVIQPKPVHLVPATHAQVFLQQLISEPVRFKLLSTPLRKSICLNHAKRFVLIPYYGPI